MPMQKANPLSRPTRSAVPNRPEAWHRVTPLFFSPQGYGWPSVGCSMSNTYVIDGYNLLYAMGVLQKRMAPSGLEKARLRLLGLLRNVFGDDAPSVTVVFDAAHPPPESSERHEHRGLDVRFAVQYEQADDLIEQLIRKSSSPKQLIVVSDDHRIQKAARRRQCQAQGCLDFLDGLDRRLQQRHRQQPEPPEKQAGSSPRETQHWLAAFADLDQDADMKELFNPFDFDKP